MRLWGTSLRGIRMKKSPSLLKVDFVPQKAFWQRTYLLGGIRIPYVGSHSSNIPEPGAGVVVSSIGKEVTGYGAVNSPVRFAYQKTSLGGC